MEISEECRLAAMAVLAKHAGIKLGTDPYTNIALSMGGALSPPPSQRPPPPPIPIRDPNEARMPSPRQRQAAGPQGEGQAGVPGAEVFVMLRCSSCCRKKKSQAADLGDALLLASVQLTSARKPQPAAAHSLP
jgi:hypothetical protein